MVAGRPDARFRRRTAQANHCGGVAVEQGPRQQHCGDAFSSRVLDIEESCAKIRVADLDGKIARADGEFAASGLLEWNVVRWFAILSPTAPDR